MAGATDFHNGMHCGGRAGRDRVHCDRVRRLRPRAAVWKSQGEGRVGAVIDARSFRMEDGREVLLAGIETVGKSDRNRALSALVAGRDMTLRGESDAPDRYGRQPAFVFSTGRRAVQSLLLARAKRCFRECRRHSMRRGALRRRAVGPAGQARRLGRTGGHKKRGKSGRYFGQDRAVHGGRGEGSVGAAGRGDTYINFGRRWTRDFAVTISRRMMRLRGCGNCP